MDLLRAAVVIDADPDEVAQRAAELPPPRLIRSVRQLQHATSIIVTGAGTVVVDEFSWAGPRGPVGRLFDELVLRRRVLAWIRVRNAALAQLPGRPDVVAAAILDGRGNVLAAQRATPPALAGRWEFPGGKREPGEDEITALIRECREELGVGIAPSRYLGSVTLPDGVRTLRVWAAWLVDGEPQALEHRALGWVGADDLDALDWLAVDRPLLAVLGPLLAASANDPIAALSRQRHR